MSAILYGNLGVEIASRHGARLTRMTLRQNPADLLRPQRPDALARPSILGREQQSADAFHAIQQGSPIEFHADCGYGKTTLLQHIAASASDWYSASSCIYLRADRGRVDDLLQQLVDQLYSADQPVKLTPGECAQLLRQSRLVVAIDDAPADPAQIGYLLEVLSGSSLVIGSARQVAVRGGSSYELAGLPMDAALSLLAADLGRSLTDQELQAARDLAAAVDGQPLHLKQAAALVREGSHSLASLASQAAADATVLDRLSISALTSNERRALAVLAFAAGALLPPEIVDVIGQAAQLGECLASLHRRGLAEQRRDRFGLPVCKAESYRKMLLGDLQLGASVVGLSNWLAASNRTASESQSAVGAALSIIDFAAEREDWMTVVQLARVAEQILYITSRWQAWHHVLSQGLTAAKAAHASTIEAYFSHQLGSLELCLDHLDEASRLLRHALTLREQDGDTDGADLTRHNLQLVEPPPPPLPPPRPRVQHAVVVALTVVLTVLGLIVGAVALASTKGGGGPDPSPSPSISSPHSTSSAPGNQVAVPSVTGRTQAQATSALQAAGLTAAPTTTTNCTTADNGNVVTQDPAGGTSVAKGTSVTIGVCSAAPAPVKVPDVTGQTQAQATSALQAAGLTAAPTTTTNCTTADNGNVVTEDPVGGTSVAKGTRVTIGVCSAPPPTVPNVIGESQAAATATLQAQGLAAVTTITSNCSTADNGNVVTEDPAGGTSISQGASVTIGICNATPPPPPPPVPVA
jgi:beta-lactam-binding protein with PASTA domain